MKTKLLFTKVSIAGIFTTILFLSPFVSISQSNFKKGYFVNTGNDTVHGFIRYRELAGNPRSFSFKPSETATESEQYSISQVRYFSIEGYQDFETHFVSMTMNEVMLDGLSESTAGPIQDTVFLKVLVKGNHLDMFSYTDKIKTRFYIKETGMQSPVELLYKQEKERILPIFQQQLSTIAIKYNKLSDQLNRDISSSRYTKPSISKIVYQVNDNARETFSAVKDKKQKFRLFAGAGISYSRLRYEGENIVTYQSATPSSSPKYREHVTTTHYSPAISFGVDMFSNPEVQRLIIRNEIAASLFHSTTESVYTFYYPEEQVAYEYQVSAAFISYSPQLIYNVLNGKGLKWNVGAGPSFFFWSYGKNQTHQKPLAQSAIFTDRVTKNYMKMNKSTVGLVVRSGILVNKRMEIGLKALVNPSIISNKERTTTMKFSFVNLGINYLFTRKH